MAVKTMSRNEWPGTIIRAYEKAGVDIHKMQRRRKKTITVDTRDRQRDTWKFQEGDWHFAESKPVDKPKTGL